MQTARNAIGCARLYLACFCSFAHAPWFDPAPSARRSGRLLNGCECRSSFDHACTSQRSTCRTPQMPRSAADAAACKLPHSEFPCPATRRRHTHALALHCRRCRCVRGVGGRVSGIRPLERACACCSLCSGCFQWGGLPGHNSARANGWAYGAARCHAACDRRWLRPAGLAASWGRVASEAGRWSLWVTPGRRPNERATAPAWPGQPASRRLDGLNTILQVIKAPSIAQP